jgi:Leucine-rich repeat (LRR) protein
VTLPDALLGLSSLTQLDLGENQLVEIPEGMSRLTALDHLDLAGNRHLISPPPAIVAKGSDEVLAYFRRSMATSLDAGQRVGSVLSVPAATCPRSMTTSRRGRCSASAAQVRDEQFAGLFVGLVDDADRGAQRVQSGVVGRVHAPHGVRLDAGQQLVQARRGGQRRQPDLPRGGPGVGEPVDQDLQQALLGLGRRVGYEGADRLRLGGGRPGGSGRL